MFRFSDLGEQKSKKSHQPFSVIHQDDKRDPNANQCYIDLSKSYIFAALHLQH